MRLKHYEARVASTLNPMRARTIWNLTVAVQWLSSPASCGDPMIGATLQTFKPSPARSADCKKNARDIRAITALYYVHYPLPTAPMLERPPMKLMNQYQTGSAGPLWKLCGGDAVGKIELTQRTLPRERPGVAPAGQAMDARRE
jgi:hypothetical protein